MADGSRGRPKGLPKTGGRKKGSVNALTRSIQETLDRLGCDPFSGMAQIASGKISCGACHGKGKTKVKGTDGQVYERTCESCYGSLLEKVSPETRAKMYAELAQYIGAKRKAIELSGELKTTAADAILRARERAMNSE